MDEINIKLIPCHNDRAMYLCLAKEYVSILQKYEPGIVWEESIWDKGIWDANFIVDSGVNCGFVVSETVHFKGKRSLLYIEEFYIPKEEGRRHVGVEAVRKLVSGWDGDVFLYILDKNEDGKAFWSAVEEMLGWKRIERDDVRKEDGCELRIFEI